MDEKREFTRVPYRIEVQAGADRCIRCKEILNLSLGGCLLSVDGEMKEGEECRIEILMSGALEGQRIKVRGKVIRTEEGKAALRFTETDPESLLHLRNVVRYNAPDADAVEREIDRHPGLF
jgi:hypothetical protein